MKKHSQSEAQIGLIGRKLIYFGYNFTPNFIDEIWKDYPNASLAPHLKQKWKYYYDKVGAGEVFFRFFTELSSGHQVTLVNWINENYNDVW